MKHYPLLFAGLMLLATTTYAYEKPANSQHPLPYSADKTLQTFTKTAHGGVQHVVVKAAEDRTQIKAVQAHLIKLADEFSNGDFSTTERIHGQNMPGLAQLKRAKADDIRFAYKALPTGGQIHYSTEYPQLVQALHEWFDAQTREHGNPVIPGHSQHHLSPAE
jgi:hypothetical protein